MCNTCQCRAGTARTRAGFMLAGVSPSGGLCAAFRWSIPKVPFGQLARAVSHCSRCARFASSCLQNCSPCCLLSQDCHCLFVEAPCEPKSTAVTKSAAGLVLPMSVISVISIWRDDVYFVFPIQIRVTARSRIWDSVVQRAVLHCKPHVYACLLFLNYVVSVLLTSPID